MNTNTMELNLNEMELVCGGRWSWKQAIIGGVIGGVVMGTIGTCIGGPALGVPCAVVGAVVMGGGLGAA